MAEACYSSTCPEETSFRTRHFSRQADSSATSASPVSRKSTAVREASSAKRTRASCFSDMDEPDREVNKRARTALATERVFILFLDVDGVLHSSSVEGTGEGTFSPSCMRALKLILDSVADIRIVLSTSWRLEAANRQLVEDKLAELGYPDVVLPGERGRTPKLRGPRVSEILRWVAEHEEPLGVRGWVAIDDIPLLGLGDEHFFLVNAGTGLTQDDAAAVTAKFHA